MFTIGTVLPPPPTSRWPQPEGEEAGTTCAEKAARCGEVILAGEPFGFDNGSAEAGQSWAWEPSPVPAPYGSRPVNRLSVAATERLAVQDFEGPQLFAHR